MISKPASLFRLAAVPTLAALALASGAAAAQDGNYPPQGYPQSGGYDQPPPGYGGQGGYDQSQPGYGQSQSGYGQPQSGYFQPQSGYGQSQSGYGGPAGYDQPPPGYQGSPPPQGEYGQQGADTQAPPPLAPPSGYDGTRPPPPPPGYQPGPEDPRQQAQDQSYAAYAQQWAQAYCVRAHGDTGAGAVIGGIAGALIGSTFGGHGAGAVGGAIVGAAGGAAIANGSGSNATSPGCPPGYVVRGGARAFAYGGYGGEPYYYAAPGWYRPWVFIGGVWTYRPYPYHAFYYGRYYRPGFYGRGYHGRGYGRGYDRRR